MKSKTFYFGQYWQVYGRNTMEVPIDYTIEQAIEYVEEHRNDIGLAFSAEYVMDSDEFDFDVCGFDEEDTYE